MAFLGIVVLIWADVLTTYSMFTLSTYLTDVWDLSITHAAAIVNIWLGVALTLQSWFLYLAETVVGFFSMLVFSSIAYCIMSFTYLFMGIGFLAMSTPPVLSNATGTCSDYKPECVDHVQKALFYTALPLMAVGMSGHAASLTQFLADQIPELNPVHYTKRPLKLLSCFGLIIGPLVGSFALPYIKPWSLRFGIPAVFLLVATLLFLKSSFSYVKKPPQGSPAVTNIARVIVASARKITEKLPGDPKDLYEIDNRYAVFLPHTHALRCLDKAAIRLPNQEQEKNRWKLCRVSEVEVTKIVIRMVPMFATFIFLGIVSSIGNTFFVIQADSMNPKIGKWKIPLQVFQLIYDMSMEHIFNDIALQLNNLLKRRGLKKYTPPIIITVAILFSLLSCVTAAKVESRRLDVIRTHNLVDKADERIPMSMFWLIPQYMFLAGLDSFITSSVIVCLAPVFSTSLATHFLFLANGMFGLGHCGSVLFVYIAGNVSEKDGNQNWFQHTVNESRLDNYYWSLAALCGVCFVLFSLAATIYPYKSMPDPADNGYEEYVSSCCCFYSRSITEPNRAYSEEGCSFCCWGSKASGEVTGNGYRNNVILDLMHG